MNKIAVLLWLASAYSFNALADDGDVSIDIKTGDISTLAIGDKANASVNIGGLPQTNKPTGCTRIHIEHGDLMRIAIGQNADAHIQLPVNQNNCKDN